VSTPTDLHTASGAVLTHPAFDRPPVHNERRRGRKKGTHSLAKASRERDAANVRSLLAAGQIERRAGFDEGYALADKHIRERRVQLGALESGAKNDAATAPTPTTRIRHEQALIDAALAILEAGLAKPGAVLDYPMRVKDYPRLQLAGREREAFGVIFLDAAHAVIAFEVLFEGTLTHTAVHPRVIVQRALVLNAAAVVLSHNHPSGGTEPSRAVELLTMALCQALSTLNVRMIDHVIVGRGEATSFAERGLL
jgi:DNA repair protein RadC